MKVHLEYFARNLCLIARLVEAVYDTLLYRKVKDAFQRASLPGSRYEG